MTLAGLRFLVLLGAGIEPSSVRAALPPAAPVTMADLQDGLERAAQLVDKTDPDLVLVGCSSYSEQALSIVRDMVSRRPECPVVVLFKGDPNGFVGPAFLAGADDVIVLPQPAKELAFALEKTMTRRGGSAPTRLAPMITVLGPKGGTGKTLTACNLGVALAHSGVGAAVIDIDLQFGDVGLALGLRPERTIYDLAVSGGTLDADKVEGFLTDHDSGLRVLLAPVRPDQAAAVDIAFLRRVLEIMRTLFDYVVVDTPPAFSPEVIAAIDSASHLCMVGTLDALSLKDTKIGFQTLAQMGYDPGEVALVLNRAETSVGISPGDIVALLGRKPDILVPSDRAVVRAITAGRPIVEAEPKSGAARAFYDLAEYYIEESRAALINVAASVGEQVGPVSRRRPLLRMET